jgi:CRP-like cAMP-binding protein
VFNIIAGVVKFYSEDADGRRPHIVGFLFRNDIFGLAENGKYANSAVVVISTTVYRIPTTSLEAELRRNPTLDFQVIAKLCHDLRYAQRHAFLLSKHRSIARLGAFIQLLEALQTNQAKIGDEVYLPMTHVDIAAYTAMSCEAVSRAFRDLVNRGVIERRNRWHLKIVDRALLETIVSEHDLR